MPRRPRAHQLEDESRRAFGDRLPRPWVLRDKDHDYGIDLEVEIFEQTDESTGLTFLVQIKATDVIAQSKRLNIAVDRLRYFESLSLPVLIVLYCSVDNSIYTCWAFNIKFEDPFGRVRKSVRISFSDADRWNDTTATAISLTLSTLRNLQAYPAGLKVALFAKNTGASFGDFYRVERAIGWLASASSNIAGNRGARVGEIAVTVTCRAGSLLVAVDCLASFETILPSDDEALRSELSYSVGATLQSLALTHHANGLARIALDARRVTGNQSAALYTSTALRPDVIAAAKLAVLNGLHIYQGAEYAAFVFFLKAGLHNEAALDEAEGIFFGAALQYAREFRDKTAVAAVHYSMGNAALGRHRAAEAIRHLNLARRLRPQYLDAGYFLSEVGNALFGAGRYRLSAAFYRAAKDREQSPVLDLFLADALLFAGFVSIARPLFDEVAECGPPSRWTEAKLKAWLCVWLVETYQDDRVPTRRSAAEVETPDLLENEVPDHRSYNAALDIDAFNEIANFNIGVYLAKGGLFKEALPHFLVCAFKRSGDVEAWTNSVLTAHGAGDPASLAVVMDCAQRMCGSDVYYSVRETMIQQRVPESAVKAWDEINRVIIAATQDKVTTFTIRALAAGSTEPTFWAVGSRRE